MKFRIKALDELRLDDEPETYESLPLIQEVAEWVLNHYGLDVDIDAQESDLSEYFTLSMEMPSPRKGSPSRFTYEVYYNEKVISKWRQGYPLKFTDEELEFFDKRGFGLESSWNYGDNDPEDDNPTPRQSMEDWF